MSDVCDLGAFYDLGWHILRVGDQTCHALMFTLPKQARWQGQTLLDGAVCPRCSEERQGLGSMAMKLLKMVDKHKGKGASGGYSRYRY